MRRLRHKCAALIVLGLVASATAHAQSTPVVVTNPLSQPVPVTPVTRAPIDLAGYATATGNYGGSCIIPLVQVPDKRRLVVEHVSGFAYQSSSYAVGASAYLSTGLGVENALTGQTIAVTHFLQVRPRTGTDAVDLSQQVTVYVKAGKTLQMVWNLPSYKPGSTCWVWVSGHYEVVP